MNAAVQHTLSSHAVDVVWKRRDVPGLRMIELLEQRKWWRSNDGTVWRRREMATEHKANTLAYLVRHAHEIAAHWWIVVPLDAPDEAHVEVERIMAQPVTWMLATPFCQALIADLIKVGERW